MKVDGTVLTPNIYIPLNTQRLQKLIYLYLSTTVLSEASRKALGSVITSLVEGGYVFGSTGLFACKQHHSQSYEQIAMKFYGGI